MSRLIAMFSGGQDSCCSVSLLHDMGLKADVVMSEVMYDLSRNISAEHPEHMEFVREKAELFRGWGMNVHIVRHESKDFLTCFHHVITNATKYPEHNGKEFGFPCRACYCKRDLKVRVADSFVRKNFGDDWIKVVGIRADEPQRLTAVHKDLRQYSVLEECGMTRELVNDYCKTRDLVSPIYGFAKRSGCFFCPNAGEEELRHFRGGNREIWEELLTLEEQPNLAFDHWDCYGRTLREYERKFRKEDADNGILRRSAERRIYYEA